MRVRLLIAYEGTAYHGWQVQPADRTVQGELLKGLSRILDRPVDEIRMQGASRTDSGVHAVGQVAHFDFDANRSLWDFVRGLNGLTDDDICIVRAEPAADDFDARRCSGGKIYRYEIWNHQFPHPLEHRRTWNVTDRLDLERMVDGARRVVGEKDFAAFRSSSCESESTKRHVRRVEVESEANSIVIEVEGDAFLQYMVRIIVGTLVDIGAGRLEPSIIDEMFETGDRSLGGITAPARGLTLMKIFYPDHPWEVEPRIGGAYLPEG